MVPTAASSASSEETLSTVACWPAKLASSESSPTADERTATRSAFRWRYAARLHAEAAVARPLAAGGRAHRHALRVQVAIRRHHPRGVVGSHRLPRDREAVRHR